MTKYIWSCNSLIYRHSQNYDPADKFLSTRDNTVYLHMINDWFLL